MLCLGVTGGGLDQARARGGSLKTATVAGTSGSLLNRKTAGNKSRRGPGPIWAPAGEAIINRQCSPLTAGGVFTEHLLLSTTKLAHRQKRAKSAALTPKQSMCRLPGGRKEEPPGGPPLTSQMHQRGHLRIGQVAFIPGPRGDPW